MAGVCGNILHPADTYFQKKAPGGFPPGVFLFSAQACADPAEKDPAARRLLSRCHLRTACVHAQSCCVAPAVACLYHPTSSRCAVLTCTLPCYLAGLAGEPPTPPPAHCRTKVAHAAHCSPPTPCTVSGAHGGRSCSGFPRRRGVSNAVESGDRQKMVAVFSKIFLFGIVAKSF